MSLYALFCNNELSVEELNDIRAVLRESKQLPGAGLEVQLIDGEFHLFDNIGPLGSTRVLDVALTVIAMGHNARTILHIPHFEDAGDPSFLDVAREIVEPVSVPMDPKAQAVARRLRESMNERRESQVGPVEHTGEGSTIRAVGEGDGDVIKG